MKSLGLVLLSALLPVMTSACSGADEPVASSPVIARAENPSVYPLALFRGSLTLREGCLMLGEDAVFWPAGTIWEPDTNSVTFSEKFEGAPSLSVGDQVELVGGIIGGSADVRAVMDDEQRARDALLACLEATGAEGAAFVYPERAS